MTLTILLISGLLFHSVLFAEIMDIKSARQVAENKIFQLADNSDFQIKNEKSFFLENQPLFYTFGLSPCGYVVISADTDLPPVIAYSFENNFTQAGEENNPLKSMLLADLTFRKTTSPIFPQKLYSKEIRNGKNSP
ncbi:MAG: Spi family protease inhibitor [Bacteroidales bacterium]